MVALEVKVPFAIHSYFWTNTTWSWYRTDGRIIVTITSLTTNSWRAPTSIEMQATMEPKEPIPNPLPSPTKNPPFSSKNKDAQQPKCPKAKWTWRSGCPDIQRTSIDMKKNIHYGPNMDIVPIWLWPMRRTSIDMKKWVPRYSKRKIIWKQTIKYYEQVPGHYVWSDYFHGKYSLTFQL